MPVFIEKKELPLTEYDFDIIKLSLFVAEREFLHIQDILEISGLPGTTTAYDCRKMAQQIRGLNSRLINTEK